MGATLEGWPLFGTTVGRVPALDRPREEASVPAPDTSAAPGLRQRKKDRTRTEIQGHALRLFRDQGFHATTVEQVAAAAEVAPSTVFRYFPRKEDVLLEPLSEDAAGLSAPPDFFSLLLPLAGDELELVLRLSFR